MQKCSVMAFCIFKKCNEHFMGIPRLTIKGYCHEILNLKILRFDLSKFYSNSFKKKTRFSIKAHLEVINVDRVVSS